MSRIIITETEAIPMALRNSGVLLVLFFLIGGCGTFSHEKTPSYTTIPEHLAVGRRPSISLSVKASTKNAGTTKVIIDERNTENLKKIAAKVTENSQLFERYSLEYPEAISPDYIIEMEFVHDFSSDSWTSLPLALWQGASAGTLWVVPFPATIQQKLTTKITERHGNFVKTYYAADGATAWVSIWSLIFGKEQMETVLQENWEKLIGNTYRIMMNDDSFRQAMSQEY